MEEVIDDWFKRLGGYHASREGHRIGNSKKFIKSEIVVSVKDLWKTIVE